MPACGGIPMGGEQGLRPKWGDHPRGTGCRPGGRRAAPGEQAPGLREGSWACGGGSQGESRLGGVGFQENPGTSAGIQVLGGPEESWLLGVGIQALGLRQDHPRWD